MPVRAALALSLRRPSPLVIPRSLPGASGLDCFSVNLADRGGSWEFLAKKLVPEGVEGFWLNGERFDAPVSIPNKHLHGAKLRVSHYIGIHEFEYSSPYELLWKELLGLPRLAVLRDRLSQYLFNRKKLVRQDRMTILRLIFEQTLKDRKFAISAVSLLGPLYTIRWVFHPQKDELLSYCTFLLDSLVETGELVADRGSAAYRLAPKALATLAAYEEDARKHEDMLKQQTALKWLTFALIFVGLLQAYASWKSS